MTSQTEVDRPDEVAIAFESFDAETWDPSQSQQQRHHGLVFETLYRNVPPDGEVAPDLVADDTVSDDNLTWTLTLNEGITFSNGDPMTAEDVAFSLERYRSEESVSPQAGQFRDGIAEIRVIDDLTVELALAEPWPTLRHSLTRFLGVEGTVLPKAYIEEVGWEAFNREPVGSGPYRLVEHNVGDSMVFEAFDDYWRGTPPFERVTLLAVPEEEARIVMLESGDADLISDVSPERVDELVAADFTALSPPDILTWFVGFLGSFPEREDVPTSIEAVRHALDYSTDKEAINEALHGGRGEVIPYAPNTASSLGGPDGLQPTPYDVEEGRRLLEEAGFADGFALDLYAPNQPWCAGETGRRIGETLVDMWSQVGVQATLHSLEYSAFRPQFLPDLSPDLVGSAVLFCPRQTPMASRDLFIWHFGQGPVKLTDVADAEIGAALSASTQTDMVAAAEEAYRKIHAAHVTVPLLSGSLTFVASDTLADLPVFPGEVNLLTWLLPDGVTFDD